MSVGWATCTADFATLPRGVEGSLRVVTVRVGGELCGFVRFHNA